LRGVVAQNTVGDDPTPCPEESSWTGQGHWYENVTTKTPSGGTVVTQKRVSCRPCGGTGQIPDSK
jgi:hypothetical protein